MGVTPRVPPGTTCVHGGGVGNCSWGVVTASNVQVCYTETSIKSKAAPWGFATLQPSSLRASLSILVLINQELIRNGINFCQNEGQPIMLDNLCLFIYI